MLALASLSLASARPVEIAPGATYPGGTEVGVAALGVSFTVPAGWTATLAPSGEALVMGSTTVPGLLVAMAEPATLEQAKQALSEIVPLDVMTNLVPTGELEVLGDRVRRSFDVALRPKQGGQGVALVGTNGTGVALLAAGPRARAATYTALLDEVAGSVVFSEIAAPEAAQPATPPSTGAWADRVRGKRITYLYTSGDFSDTWKLDLCVDVTFRYYSSSSSSSVSSGSLFMSGRDRGVWTVSGDRIHLAYADGSTEDAALAGDGGVVYWSGTKAWLDGVAICQ